MDETPKYIKKCEKAEEIQKKWKKGSRDYSHDFIKFPESVGDLLTWLPRQDQLQKMVTDIDITINKTKGHKKWDLWLEQDEMGPNKIEYFDTLEQLWLAVVMKELHGKVWDDEKEEWR